MVASASFKFDEVGVWSELKLGIVEKYGAAYTKAFGRPRPNQPRLKKYYVDAFSGAGVHVSKRSGKQIEGSPARALKISPPFDGFFFIDMNERKTAHLKSLCAGRQKRSYRDWRCFQIPHRQAVTYDQVRELQSSTLLV